MSIQRRKQDHVRLTLHNQSEYDLSSGFDAISLRHNALPEINLDDISTKAILCERTFRFPLMISSMTGGYAGAVQVNEILARCAQEFDIPIGVGSQRAMLEDDTLTPTFSVVRKHAPDAFVAANIGGAQLRGQLSEDHLKRLIDSIRADAIIVHLNPLQELMQPEGDRDFEGILDGIARLIQSTSLPVIVKETGAGIDIMSARLLLDAGVAVIDVAGAGGTSWSKVEQKRRTERYFDEGFANWGIPTVDCITSLRSGGVESAQIIASGGIRTPFDTIKALCLGAGFTATAQPLIQCIHEGGEQLASDWLNQFDGSLRQIMLLLGVKRINDLSAAHILPQNSGV